MAGQPRFWDPRGERFGIPTYPWNLAPLGLATRRQLREQGLRPGGQDVVAQLMWHSNRYRQPGSPGIRAAYLYDVDRAKPVRPMTPGRVSALAKAMRARRTCPDCQRDAGYVIPTSLGTCTDCSTTQEQRAA
ncbi:RRQRL motif-containing zinc-binding protein [Streptomyces sp. NPDC001549]|uniref:RRQRL motif-containing zinc-binding protein n=1 Tax=Streptomyces sp. NPDC001549 TaxID=3364586 RepID=UPI0036876037